MLKLVLYIVVGLLVLSFFGVSLQRLIEAPATQSNFSYIGNAIENGWNDLVDEVEGFWEHIF